MTCGPGDVCRCPAQKTLATGEGLHIATKGSVQGKNDESPVVLLYQVMQRKKQILFEGKKNFKKNQKAI